MSMNSKYNKIRVYRGIHNFFLTFFFLKYENCQNFSFASFHFPIIKFSIYLKWLVFVMCCLFRKSIQTMATANKPQTKDKRSNKLCLHQQGDHNAGHDPLNATIRKQTEQKHEHSLVSNSHKATKINNVPVSILRKSISGRYRPVRVADGPMTARCRFT